jgi:endonuclease/exonuclease/phosphatase family metal-dependent hydrolase
LLVYGPQGDEDKQVFLKQIKQSMNPRWLLLGDFNLIYWACDKNNGHVNRRLMNSFCSTVNELEIKEIHMHGRQFTWSSGTTDPTMTKIDHIFATRDWETAYPHCHGTKQSQTTSHQALPASQKIEKVEQGAPDGN